MLTIKVPVNEWQALLNIEDLNEYDGPLDIETDSCKRVVSEGEDPRYPGITLEYELCSGQSNYWYTVNVWKNGELIGQSEPQNCIDDDDTSFLVVHVQDLIKIEYNVESTNLA